MQEEDEEAAAARATVAVAPEAAWSDSAEYPYLAWAEEQRGRSARILRMCRAHQTNQSLWPDFGDTFDPTLDFSSGTELWMKVSDQYKVISCVPAKVASTAWKVLFYRLAGHVEEDVRQYEAHTPRLLRLSGLQNLGSVLHDRNVTLQDVLDTHSAFTVVRHPFARLHSAFTEKFRVRGNGAVYGPAAKLGRQIQEKYQGKRHSTPLTALANISFRDFVRYLGDKSVPATQRLRDTHWKPYYMTCLPCQLRYDYVVKFETMSADAHHLLAHVFNSSLRLEKMNVLNATSLSAYDDIPAEYVHNLWETYRLDFELFGYTWP